MTRIQRLLTLALALALFAAPGAAAPPQNLTLIGRIDLPGFNDALFVHDNLVFFLRDPGTPEMRIYDVADPGNPVLLSTTVFTGLTPNTIADMHGIYYSNGIVYAGIERDGGGFFVIDATDPRKPNQIGAFHPIPSGVHNLRLYQNFLFVVSNYQSEAVDFYVYDVTNLASPLEVAQYRLPSVGDYCHDIGIMDGIAYASMWHNGLFLLDVHDPLNLQLIGNSDPRPSTHSAWPTADRSHVLTCHEAKDEGVRVWALGNGGSTITEVANYQSHDTAATTVVHDLMVVGNHAYVTYYREGVRVLDITKPAAPVEVASYLTGASCTGPLVFCNAIAQWVEDGRLYILDMDNGLWIFSFDLPHPAPITLYAVKTASGAVARLTWNHTGESQYTVRRGQRKDTVTGATMIDIDGELRRDDPVVRDGNLYFYRINGPGTGL